MPHIVKNGVFKINCTAKFTFFFPNLCFSVLLIIKTALIFKKHFKEIGIFNKSCTLKVRIPTERSAAETRIPIERGSYERRIPTERGSSEIRMPAERR